VEQAAVIRDYEDWLADQLLDPRSAASEGLALIPAACFLMALLIALRMARTSRAGNTCIRTIVMDLLKLALMVRSSDATVARGRLSTQVIQ